jgi:hypothetical protein
MIISEAEIKRCIDAIVAAGPAEVPTYAYLTTAERAEADFYRNRIAKSKPRGNSRIGSVKRAIALSDYRIPSDEVANKLLGRVISDKLR